MGFWLCVNELIVMNIYIYIFIYIYIYICIYISPNLFTHIIICIYMCISSSSSYRAGSTDIPDPLSPLLPIVHRPR